MVEAAASTIAPIGPAHHQRPGPATHDALLWATVSKLGRELQACKPHALEPEEGAAEESAKQSSSTGESGQKHRVEEPEKEMFRREEVEP